MRPTICRMGPLRRRMRPSDKHMRPSDKHMRPTVCRMRPLRRRMRPSDRHMRPSASVCAPQPAICARSNPDHSTWQRCGSHRGQSKSRFTLSKVNKTLTLIGRIRTLSDVTDGRTNGRDGRTDAQTTLDVPTEDARDVSVNYIGVLRNILKLDYGPMRTPVILLRCEWIKRSDNRENPTYVQDEAGFLVVNFRHKLPSMCDPFIFPSQATQVFFSDDPGKAGWKVVLRKEPRARQEVADTSDVFISTSVETSALMSQHRTEYFPTMLQILL
jgi:hypothetical protein